MAKRSMLTLEQRAQVVLRLLSKGEPAVQIAQRAKISEQALYRWRDEFINAGKQAVSGRGAMGGQAKEFARLCGELTIANRLLKNSRAA